MELGYPRLSRWFGHVVLVACAFAFLAGGLAASASAVPNRTVAWGSNARGQLGTGNFTNSDLPVAAGELLGVSAIAAGGYDSFALMNDATIEAWGDNQAGQLGSGTSERESTEPVTVAGVTGATALATGGGYALVGSEVTGWDAGGPFSEGVGEASAISEGGGFALALLKDGTVRAWGGNRFGQLGNGESNEGGAVGPVEVCAEGSEGPCPHGPFLTGVEAVAAGEEHSLALLENGTVVAWGYDQLGQLGNGIASPFLHFPNPAAVGGVSEVTAISAGGTHSMALEKNGTVIEWGSCCAENGVLPATVAGVSGVISIAAGGGHSLALLNNGTVKAWGNNNVGQLGDGNHKFSSAPVTVTGLSGIVAIAAGESHSVALGPAPAPAVTHVLPNYGSSLGGTLVTITGTNFTGATAVHFGGVPAASFTGTSTTISAVSPAQPLGNDNITVTTPSGTSAVSSRDLFKVAPQVTGLSPSSGPAAGGTTLTVTGTGFGTAAKSTVFKFGTAKTTAVGCISTTECTVTVPPHAKGTVDVRATTSKETSPNNPPGDRYAYE